MSNCPVCEQEAIRDSAKYCDKCGANLAVTPQHAGVTDRAPLATRPDFTMQNDVSPSESRLSNTTDGPTAHDAAPSHENPTLTPDRLEAPQSARGRGRFVGATLVSVAAVSTVTQYISAAAFGLPMNFSAGDRVWSTGGLVAVIASIYMGVKCTSWPDFRRRISAWIGLTAVLAFGTVALIAGFNNAYTFTVVDQESRAETFHRELTGRYDVEYDSDRICGGGDDYYACVHSHVVLYNTICVRESLTRNGEKICAELSDFVDGVKARLKTCGSGCETRAEGGVWGWPYLQLVPETALVSNGDSLLEISHLEHCNFELGPFKIGNCSRTREP